jgi:hypothetical protein
MIKRSKVLSLAVFLLISHFTYSQVHSFDAGVRLQKTIGLYYENGITGQYNLSSRWVVGATYISSRLGSAINSNAIRQDNVMLSGAYLFRPSHSLKPFLRANAGYFNADYESDIFDGLSHSSAIASADAGLVYYFKNPLKINASLGYNAITGNGVKGAGTLYPVFFQTSLTWNFANPPIKCAN